MSGTPVIGGGKVGHIDGSCVGLRLLKVTEKQSTWKSRGVVDVWFQRSRCLTMLFRIVRNFHAHPVSATLPRLATASIRW